MNSRAPPLAPPSPIPGRWTLWVPSKITGASHASRMRGIERRSTTRSPYPKNVPRSVTATSMLDAELAPRTLFTAPRMPSGCSHCPFFTFPGLPVAPAASRRSVCLHRKAGICRTSTTSAAAAHCSGRWTSVRTGSPVSRLTRASFSRPSSIPGPRAAPALDLFALSKLALNTIPPGTRSARRASASPTCRLSESSSRTHGPAMRKKRSRGRSAMSARSLDERILAGGSRSSRRCAIALRTAARAFTVRRCGVHEITEERMRTHGARLELRMKLAPHEPRMVIQLHYLNECPVRRQSAEYQTIVLERLPESVRHLVAVPMAFTHLGCTVGTCRTSSCREATDVGTQTHAAAHVLHLLLRLHERDNRVVALGRELAGVAVFNGAHVARKLYDGCLHSQADTEERQLCFAGNPNGFEHSIHPAHAEATWYQESVIVSKNLLSRLGRREAITGDPADVHAYVIADTAVDEGFLYALVAVYEIRVLAHDRNAHAAAG